MFSPSRRSLLRALTAAGFSAPLWPLLDAHGAGPTKPTRFLLVWQPNGLDRANWLREDDSFGPILQPLTPVKNSVVVLKNFSNKRSGGGADPHVASGAGSTTGRPISGSFDGSESTGESIDYLLSQRIGKDRPRKLLNIRPGKNAVSSGHLSHSGAKSPIPAEIAVEQTFGTMFAGMAGAGMGTGTGTLDPTAAAKLRARKKSVLDVIAGDLTLVQSKLGTRDKAKLDAHLTSIRELETSLTTPVSAPAPVAVKGCHTPDITEQAGPGTTFHRYMNLTLAAFACDHTRVASYQWGGPGSHSTWRVPGADPTSNAPKPGQVQVEKVGAWTHHNVDHGKINAGIGYTGEMLGQMRVAIQTHYMEHFAWLIQRLKSIPEGTGTMLDNTVVVWMQESSGNGHSGSGVPFYVAGGGLQGKVLDVAGASQNDAWLSVARMLGVELTTFGDPTWVKGPISGLG